MGTFATPTIIEYTSAGIPSGRAWCNTSVGYMGFSGVVSAGSIPGQASYSKFDFVPTAGGLSVGVSLTCILSVGTDLFQVAVGNSVTASYVPQNLRTRNPAFGMGNVVETWTRIV